MISENIKMFEPHVLILNLTVTTDILKGKKNNALSSHSIYYT